MFGEGPQDSMQIGSERPKAPATLPIPVNWVGSIRNEAIFQTGSNRIIYGRSIRGGLVNQACLF